MNTPGPRVASESTAANCGSGNTAVGDSVTSVPAGRTLSVRWDGNHDAGDVNLYLITPAVANPSTALLNANVLRTGVPYKTRGSPSTQVTIPEDTTPAVYTLVWSWSGYWSCSEIRVLSRPPTGSTPLDGSDTLFRLENDHGTFDAESGMLTCDGGYSQTTTDDGSLNCASSGGVAFGIAFGVIVIVALVAFAGVVIFLKAKKPEKFAAMKGWFSGNSGNNTV